MKTLDGNTYFLDIVAVILQGDTLTPYLFPICLVYIFWTSTDLMKENGFTLKKVRSRRYPTQIITDADYADDRAHLANTPTQAESLLHSLEQAAGSIGCHVNADKTEYMCFNKKKWWLSEISGQVHLPQKQHLIHWKWHQYETSEGIDCYW